MCGSGAAHMALKLFEEAKDDCTNALRRKPDYWKVRPKRLIICINPSLGFHPPHPHAVVVTLY